MSWGVGGDREEDVPDPLFEIEVETDMPPAEVAGGNDMSAYQNGPSRPHSPLPELSTMVPLFGSARAFGEWIFDVLKTRASRFLYMSDLFVNYYRTPRLSEVRKLIRFGKMAFRQSNRYLHFLEGLYIVSASLNHKRYINKVYRINLIKLLPTED